MRWLAPELLVPSLVVALADHAAGHAPTPPRSRPRAARARLPWLRGIDTPSAAELAAEIGDLARFRRLYATAPREGGVRKPGAGPATVAPDLGPLDAVLLTHGQHADNVDAAGQAAAVGFAIGPSR